MDDLHGVLWAHNYPELPVDPRTLLQTNLVYTVENECGGTFVYLSLT